MTQNQRRQHRLFRPGKTRQVRVRQDIGAASVVGAVGDLQTDLVQLGRPGQHVTVLVCQPPFIPHLVEQPGSRRRHVIGVLDIQVPALHRRRNRNVTRIVVLEPPHQIVQQAFAQGLVRHPHLRNTQRFEDRGQNSDPSGQHRRPIGFQGFQGKLVDAALFDHRVLQLVQRIQRDPAFAPALRVHDIANGLDGAGAPDRLFPVARAHVACDRVEHQFRIDNGPCHPFLGNHAVAEIFAARADAARVKAFPPFGFDTLADDQLGTAAADIGDQSLA